MQIKKSQLYSSIWAACDELRGGMDASQYKDYVLVLLFVHYVSEKYQGNNGIVEIPQGGSFADMLKLKGKNDIGEGINKVLAKLETLQAEIEEQNENLLDDNEQEIDEVAEKIKKLKTEQKKTSQKIKELNADLESKVIAKYPTLTEAEIKDIVINKKWFASLDTMHKAELDKLSQSLTNQIKALAARYEQTLPQIDSEIATLTQKVSKHLKDMGFAIV